MTFLEKLEAIDRIKERDLSPGDRMNMQIEAIIEEHMRTRSDAQLKAWGLKRIRPKRAPTR